MCQNTAEPNRPSVESRAAHRTSTGCLRRSVQPANQRVTTSTETNVLSMNPILCLLSLCDEGEWLGYHGGAAIRQNWSSEEKPLKAIGLTSALHDRDEEGLWDWRGKEILKPVVETATAPLLPSAGLLVLAQSNSSVRWTRLPLRELGFPTQRIRAPNLHMLCSVFLSLPSTSPVDKNAGLFLVRIRLPLKPQFTQSFPQHSVWIACCYCQPLVKNQNKVFENQHPHR